MASYSALMSSLRKLDMNELALVSIQMTEPDIIQANTEQLLDGKTSKDVFLPDYSPGSVFVYGKRPGPWTLRDTGAFHDSFFLKSDSFPVLFEASDEKKDLIFEKLQSRGYVPEEIFGIPESRKAEITQRVKKNFGRLLRDVLHLR